MQQLTIGAFSRLTHLSVKTLRYYHEVGLLEPAVVDPDSGYLACGTIGPGRLAEPDRIADAVCRALAPEASQADVVVAPTQNPLAYEFYMRAVSSARVCPVIPNRSA